MGSDLAACRISLGVAAVLNLVLGTALSHAIVIDDFTVGPIYLIGPTTETQTGLDPAHVLGGSREFDVGRFGFGSVVDIDPNTGLSFYSSGYGYLTLAYDLTADGSGTDLTQGGQDRIRLTFGEIQTTSFTPLALYVTLPPNSSGSGVSLYLGDWDDLVLEFPFDAFSTSLTSAQNLTLSVSRNAPDAAFVIKSITTAAPPIPGDFNRDGAVNEADYRLWQRFRGISTRNGLKFAIASADGNSNGVVDAADFVLWRKNAEPPIAAANFTTPEPDAIAIAIAAAAMLAASTFRRGYVSRRISSAAFLPQAPRTPPPG